jgi:hypothetical protein
MEKPVFTTEDLQNACEKLNKNHRFFPGFDRMTAPAAANCTRKRFYFTES